MKRFFSILLLCLALLPACKRSTTVGVDDEPIGIETIQQVMPKDGVVEVPKHGKEVWFAYGAMAGTDWTPANGLVTAHVFEDDTYILSMSLNIAVARNGSFYEVWLSHPETKEYVSAGHLANTFGDVRHSAQFDTKEDRTRFTDVSVTVEKDDGNPERSTEVVATGVLKKTKR